MKTLALLLIGLAAFGQDKVVIKDGPEHGTSQVRFVNKDGTTAPDPKDEKIKALEAQVKAQAARIAYYENDKKTAMENEVAGLYTLLNAEINRCKVELSKPPEPAPVKEK